MKLWHGSSEIVRHPSLKFCRPTNDYGSAFYCTPSRDMACEWTCPTKANGFVNSYELNLDGLALLNLESGTFTILHWLTVLVEHRIFEPKSAMAVEGISYLKKNFSVDLHPYDVVLGYRADDSYFSFARAFLNNTLSVAQLSEAMRLGNLGIQYALPSEKALEHLTFLGSELVPSSKYRPLREERDHKARDNFQRMSSKPDLNGLFMRDILREQVMPDDPRLQG